MKKIILIIILCFSFSVSAEICANKTSTIIKGSFIDKRAFYGESNYCRFEHPVEDRQSETNITLNIDGKEYTYIYIGGGAPKVEVSNLGVISIVDLFGGMQSPVKITYLTSQNKQLIELGQIDMIYDIGLVYSYTLRNVNNKIDSFSVNLLKEKRNDFIDDTPLSYPDAFLLLFSKDELKKNTDAIWMRKFFAKLHAMNLQDVINLYNKNIFFENQTLCNQGKYEVGVFGCKIRKKQLSICYEYQNEKLFYRYGNQSNIDLELRKNISDQSKNYKTITFSNTNTDYIVNSEEGKEGILIKQNGKIISDLKCEYNSVQPMILDGFY